MADTKITQAETIKYFNQQEVTTYQITYRKIRIPEKDVTAFLFLCNRFLLSSTLFQLLEIFHFEFNERSISILLCNK